MKVLCIHPALAPYRLDFFNMLAKHVDLEVAFVHKNVVNQKFNQAMLTSQARFRYCHLNGFDIKGRNFRFGIGRIIRECKPDAVLTYEASPITIWLCILKVLRIGRWQLWTSMDEASCSILSRKGIRAWVRNWVLRHCDGVMVPSAASGDAYRSLAVPILKTAVVPIVHDTATIRANDKDVITAGRIWRSDFVPCEWKKVLLFVGRLTKVKNLHWLIAQMAKLDESIGLVLVGDGDDKTALKEYVADTALSGRVLFAGKKEGDDLYAVMSAADGLVLPSIFEPYGAVVAEAMQWGTPCIVRDTCGCKILVDNIRNGAVYHDDDEFLLSVAKVFAMKYGTDSILGIELKDAVKNLVYAFKP